MNTSSSRFRAGVLGLLLSGTSLHAAVIFDSLGNNPVAAVDVFSANWVGQSFLVGADDYTLTSVVLEMINGFGGGNFLVRIYAATGPAGPPVSGIGLATLIGSADPAVPGNYTYTPAGTINLAANTTYWVVAGVSTGSAVYNWLASISGPSTGSGIGYSVSGDQGVTWAAPALAYTQIMQVNGDLAVVPEPVTMALGIFGLLLGGAQSFRWWNARKARLSHS